MCGLRAGLFAEAPEEVDTWLERIESGMCYVNRERSATTGALVRTQPFGGWKVSTDAEPAGPDDPQAYPGSQCESSVSASVVGGEISRSARTPRPSRYRSHNGVPSRSRARRIPVTPTWSPSAAASTRSP